MPVSRFYNFNETKTKIENVQDLQKFSSENAIHLNVDDDVKKKPQSEYEYEYSSNGMRHKNVCVCFIFFSALHFFGIFDRSQIRP